MEPIVDLAKFKQELLPVLQKYSEADPRVLGDFVIALTKQAKSPAELLNQFYRELQPFMTEKAQLRAFILHVIQLMVRCHLMSQESERQIMQDRRMIQQQMPPQDRFRRTPSNDSGGSGWQTARPVSQRQEDGGRQTARPLTQRKDTESGWQTARPVDRGLWSQPPAENEQKQQEERRTSPRRRGSDRELGPVRQSYRQRQAQQPYDSQPRERPRYEVRPPPTQQQRFVEGPLTNRINVTNMPREVLQPIAPDTVGEDGTVLPEYDPEQAIREYFSKYGAVAKITVHPFEARCLVHFAAKGEEGVNAARAATSDTAAIMNNRFIRVYHIRDPPPSQEELDAAEVQMAVPLMTKEELEAKRLETAELKEQLRLKVEELARKQDEERKLLLSKLGIVSQEDKQAIMQSLSTVSKAMSGANTAAGVQAGMATVGDQGGMAEFQRQHQELGHDSHAPQLVAPINEWHGKYAPRGLRGSVRGQRGSRGTRGRGGRGGSSSQRVLDNRVRTVVISPYSHGLKQPAFQSTSAGARIPSILQKHLHQFGYVEQFATMADGAGGDVALARFSQRWEAEKCLADGHAVSWAGTEHKIQVKWADTNDLPEGTADDTHGSQQSLHLDAPMVLDMDVEMDE